MAREKLGQILLGGATNPYAAFRCLTETGNNLLQLKQKLLTIADKLADLIHKEEEAIVVTLVCEVMTYFSAEGLWSQGNGIALNTLVNGIVGKIRLHRLGDINEFT